MKNLPYVIRKSLVQADGYDIKRGNNLDALFQDYYEIVRKYPSFSPVRSMLTPQQKDEESKKKVYYIYSTIIMSLLYLFEASAATTWTPSSRITTRSYVYILGIVMRRVLMCSTEGRGVKEEGRVYG